MSEKDITPDELIEILKRVSYYCKSKSSCSACMLIKKRFIFGESMCMVAGLPCRWEIDESEETK